MLLDPGGKIISFFYFFLNFKMCISHALNFIWRHLRRMASIANPFKRGINVKTNRILMIALIAVIAIVSVGSCSAGFLDFLGGEASDVGTIIIDCNGTNETGQLMIIEFKDIQKNDDGTFNTSQFGTNEGEWNGNVVYVPVVDGKAEYNLTNGTEMFGVDNYITNLTEEYEIADNSTPTFDVKYLFNGDEVMSSSEHAYFDQCDVSFGGNIYYLNGTGLTEDDIVIDLPDFPESYDFVMEMYNTPEE